MRMRNKQRGTWPVRDVSKQCKVTNLLSSEISLRVDVLIIYPCNFDETNIWSRHMNENINVFIQQIVKMTIYSQEVLGLKFPQCFHVAMDYFPEKLNRIRG